MTERDKPDYDEFYYFIGKGISMWAKIENNLSTLYSYLVGDVTQAAQDSFYSVGVFRNKLQLVDEASRSGFYKFDNKAALESASERMKTWASIRNKLKKYSETRNKLAHFQLVYTSSVDLKTGNQTGPIQALARPHVKTIRPSKAGLDAFKEATDDVLTIDQVKEHVDKVKAVAQELYEFANPLLFEMHNKRLEQMKSLHEKLNNQEDP